MITIEKDWKKFAAQAHSDKDVEKAFLDQAYTFIQNKATPFMKDPHKLGFEIVFKNDSNTRMVGIFAFRVNDELLYAPVFFINGSIKGTDLLYRHQTKKFVPLTNDWCQYLISLSPYQEGRGIEKDKSARSKDGLNLRKLILPPNYSKRASYNEIVELNTGLPRAETVAEELFAKAAEKIEDHKHILKNFILEDGGYSSVELLKNACLKDENFANAMVFLVGTDDFLPSELNKEAAEKPQPIDKGLHVIKKGFSDYDIIDNREETTDQVFLSKESMHATNGVHNSGSILSKVIKNEGQEQKAEVHGRYMSDCYGAHELLKNAGTSSEFFVTPTDDKGNVVVIDTNSLDWQKAHVDDLTHVKEAEKKENNPWAICHSSLPNTSKDDPKFERCVLKVKEKTGYTEKEAKGEQEEHDRQIEAMRDAIVDEKSWWRAGGDISGTSKLKSTGLGALLGALGGGGIGALLGRDSGDYAKDIGVMGGVGALAGGAGGLLKALGSQLGMGMGYNNERANTIDMLAQLMNTHAHGDAPGSSNREVYDKFKELAQLDDEEADKLFTELVEQHKEASEGDRMEKKAFLGFLKDKLKGLGSFLGRRVTTTAGIDQELAESILDNHRGVRSLFQDVSDTFSSGAFASDSKGYDELNRLIDGLKGTRTGLADIMAEADPSLLDGSGVVKAIKQMPDMTSHNKRLEQVEGLLTELRDSVGGDPLGRGYGMWDTDGNARNLHRVLSGAIADSTDVIDRGRETVRMMGHDKNLHRAGGGGLVLAGLMDSLRKESHYMEVTEDEKGVSASEPFRVEAVEESFSEGVEKYRVKYASSNQSTILTIKENDDTVYVPCGNETDLDLATDRGFESLTHGGGLKKASVDRRGDYYLVKEARGISPELPKIGSTLYLMAELGLNQSTAEEIMDKSASSSSRVEFYYAPTVEKSATNLGFDNPPEFYTDFDSDFDVPSESPQRNSIVARSVSPEDPSNRVGDSKKFDSIQDLTEQTPESLAQLSEQVGNNSLFEHGVVGSLAKTYDSTKLIDKYIPDLEDGLDKNGRLIFLFYWKPEDFTQLYGSDDQADLENMLLSTFKSFGDLVLTLLKRTKFNSPGIATTTQ